MAMAVEEAIELLSLFSLPWRSLPTRSLLERLEPLSLEEGLEPASLGVRMPRLVVTHRRRHHHNWRR
jgi:hypothetical protein